MVIRARHASVFLTVPVALLVSSMLPAQELVPEELRTLLEPRITTLDDQNMLVVEAKGDPNTVGAQAFGLVFQLYYSTPKTPKGPFQSAPRARWPVSLDQPKSEWTGLYALQVPDSVTSLPPHDAPAGLDASVQMWEYGEVAEILHVGPYDQEQPALQRLFDHVAESGYKVIGVHEEEYLRGPTMAGPGDPEQYLTILRYRVRKVENPS